MERAQPNCHGRKLFVNIPCRTGELQERGSLSHGPQSAGLGWQGLLGRTTSRIAAAGRASPRSTRRDLMGSEQDPEFDIDHSSLSKRLKGKKCTYLKYLE